MHLYLLSTFLVAVRAVTIVPYEVKESHDVPRTWSRVGPAPKDHVMTLSISLRQGRFEELEERLREISDPEHPTYGHHLSSEQAKELIEPSTEAIDAVVEWLKDNDIASDRLTFSHAKDFVKMDLSVERTESLLQTTYHHYVHEDGGSLLRAAKWSVPRHLHEHIDTIQPTTNFMRPTVPAGYRRAPEFTEHFKRASSSIDLKSSAVGYPDISAACHNLSWAGTGCLATLYGTEGYQLQAFHQNKVGITNFLGQTQARADLREYLRHYRPEAVPGVDNFENILIANGPPSRENFTKEQIQKALGAEGDLDADLIIGLTYPTPLTIYSTGGKPPFLPDAFSSTNGNEPYLTWLDYVLSQSDSDIPSVVSISYADDEQAVPFSYAKRVCDLFAQLGARGVSVFVSSGDSGVGPTGACISNEGENRAMFVPAFPASCPYVTTVGGTQFGAFGPAPGFTYTNGSLPEVVWSIPVGQPAASGGGFSNYFAQPSYQTSTVRPYIRSLDGLWKRYYNHSGRAYPDVSALAQGVVQTWDGHLFQGAGTSAATPIVSSVFTLLNDARLAAGGRPLGFLNPLIYKLSGRGFHDITNGTNLGCTEIQKNAGFPAVKGWDAATGFGSPDFKTLRKLVMMA